MPTPKPPPDDVVDLGASPPAGPHAAPQTAVTINAPVGAPSGVVNNDTFLGLQGWWAQAIRGGIAVFVCFLLTYFVAVFVPMQSRMHETSLRQFQEENRQSQSVQFELVRAMQQESRDQAREDRTLFRESVKTINESLTRLHIDEAAKLKAIQDNQTAITGLADEVRRIKSRDSSSPMKEP